MKKMLRILFRRSKRFESAKNGSVKPGNLPCAPRTGPVFNFLVFFAAWVISPLIDLPFRLIHKTGLAGFARTVGAQLEREDGESPHPRPIKRKGFSHHDVENPIENTVLCNYDPPKPIQNLSKTNLESMKKHSISHQRDPGPKRHTRAHPRARPREHTSSVLFSCFSISLRSIMVHILLMAFWKSTVKLD